MCATLASQDKICPDVFHENKRGLNRFPGPKSHTKRSVLATDNLNGGGFSTSHHTECGGLAMSPGTEQANRQICGTYATHKKSCKKSVLAMDQSERKRCHHKSPHLMWRPCNIPRNRTANRKRKREQSSAWSRHCSLSVRPNYQKSKNQRFRRCSSTPSSTLLSMPFRFGRRTNKKSLR